MVTNKTYTSCSQWDQFYTSVLYTRYVKTVEVARKCVCGKASFSLLFRYFYINIRQHHCPFRTNRYICWHFVAGEVFHVSSIQLQKPAHWLITNNHYTKNHLFWPLTNIDFTTNQTLNTQQNFSKPDHHLLYCQWHAIIGKKQSFRKPARAILLKQIITADDQLWVLAQIKFAFHPRKPML